MSSPDGGADRLGPILYPSADERRFRLTGVWN
jgi:hypothetical protein